MKEAATFRLVEAGFVLFYLAAMGALALASFTHYHTILLYVLLPMGVIGAVLLAIGRFSPVPDDQRRRAWRP